MYTEDFFKMFLEFVHEYRDDQEMLDTLAPFLSYGWGKTTCGGEVTAESEESVRDFISLMCDNNASIEAVRAVLGMLW